MIITKDFVMLNYPKTGSSFARQALKKIYFHNKSLSRKVGEKLKICEPKLKEMYFPIIDEVANFGAMGQHGSLRQIPERYSKLPVVSIIREPIDRYISTYMFRWWVKHPPGNINEIKKEFPKFPDISFDEYMKMTELFSIKNRLNNIKPKIQLGFQSIQFIQFFCKNPEKILEQIDDEYIENNRILNELNNVTFIHQENLNEELKEFLKKVGLKLELINLINKMEKVNVTSIVEKNSKLSKPKVGAETIAEISLKDKLLYNVFPEYNL